MNKTRNYQYNKEYANKYFDKFDEIRFRVPKGDKERIRQHAEMMGESTTKFIIRAIECMIETDNK